MNRALQGIIFDHPYPTATAQALYSSGTLDVETPISFWIYYQSTSKKHAIDRAQVFPSYSEVDEKKTY